MPASTQRTSRKPPRSIVRASDPLITQSRKIGPPARSLGPTAPEDIGASLSDPLPTDRSMLRSRLVRWPTWIVLFMMFLSWLVAAGAGPLFLLGGLSALTSGEPGPAGPLAFALSEGLLLSLGGFGSLLATFALLRSGPHLPLIGRLSRRNILLLGAIGPILVGLAIGFFYLAGAIPAICSTFGGANCSASTLNFSGALLAASSNLGLGIARLKLIGPTIRLPRSNLQ